MKIDLRIITASNKTLDDEVKAGRFRADLRARLLGLFIELPPLRERREDLGLIIASLLARLAPDREVKFSADVVMALYAYRWPLNIRELEHVLAVALTVAPERIELKHLPQLGSTELSVDDDKLRATLVDALDRHGGNITAVARELGKDRTQIRRWLKRFGLDKAR